MNRYHYIKLVILSIILFSCSKEWFDAKADSNLAVPATVQDFQAILDNPSLTRSHTSFGEIAADYHYYTESIWQSLDGNVLRNVYTWTNELPYENLTSYWNNPYSSVLTVNIILDEFKKLNSNDQTSIDGRNVKAQALFQRARIFFELSQIFAPPFLDNASGSMNYGVPMKTTSDVTILSSRSSLQQSYQQIIDDLMEASYNLPVTPKFLTRASRPASFAMLSRVYLSLGRYDSALVYADKSLQDKRDLLNYSDIPVNNSSSSVIGINKEVIFLSFLPSVSSLTTNYLIDTVFYKTFENNDLRRVLFFTKNATGVVKFKGNYSASISDLFSGIATDEMFLIRAECNARKGNVDLAMKDLNDLLRTRWTKVGGSSTYIEKVATSKDAALSLILTERKKELILRGVRWSDLRRLNLEPNYAATLNRTIGGKTYTLTPGSYKYTFPIPLDVIRQTGMQQNPGWDK